MGLFDFLKTKDKQTEIIAQPKVDRPECDITKTQVMVDLFKIPQEQRDDNWRQTFYENVQTASYACGNPQIFTGPDGFPYFILRTPEPSKPFESFCIRNMKDDFLLDKGFGVAINPGENSVDWVFSYGDIVNLHLNKEFFSKTDNIEIENEVTIKKEEKVLIAQPSESFLPRQARENLKAFLQSIGIKRPKIMMVCRTIDGQVIQELAFNIFREDFQSLDQLNYRLKQISWFLPRHYVVLSLPKDTNFTSHFADL
jgi:hypothetical protein